MGVDDGPDSMLDLIGFLPGLSCLAWWDVESFEGWITSAEMIEAIEDCSVDKASRLDG